LVLFDLDDTLCDYARARDGRLRQAFAPAAVHAPEIDLERLVAASVAIHPHGTEHFAELLREHGIADPAVAEAAATWYRTNRFHGLELFADAVATLERLRRDVPDRRIGLITNGPTEVQRAKIDLLGVGQLVDFALVSEEFGAWKPDPAIFVEALRLGGATAAEAVFIGDSAEHDIAGARAAGIRAIWINRSGRPWTHAAAPPDFEVADLDALHALLGGDRTAADPLPPSVDGADTGT
jgi:putative hydrolase of the HAD superfamily